MSGFPFVCVSPGTRTNHRDKSAASVNRAATNCIENPSKRRDQPDPHINCTARTTPLNPGWRSFEILLVGPKSRTPQTPQLAAHRDKPVHLSAQFMSERTPELHACRGFLDPSDVERRTTPERRSPVEHSQEQEPTPLSGLKSPMFRAATALHNPQLHPSQLAQDRALLNLLPKPLNPNLEG